MKKPELNDYNLTQNDFIIYEKQKEKYDKKYSAGSERCEKINLIIKIVITVAVFIYAVLILLYIIMLNQEVSEFLLLLLVFGIPVIIVLFCAIKFGDNDDQDNWIGTLLLFTCLLPIIGFGMALCFLVKKTPKLNKYVFINKELDNKISKYNADMREYKEYLLRTKEEFWKNLSGYEFEKEVAKVFEKQGFETFVTKKTGDGGIDVILKMGDKRIAVQCKHHKSKVGPNDVRALQGVVYNGGFTSGIFVSLNGFTPTVEQEVYRSKVQIGLISLKDLLSLCTDDCDDEVELLNTSQFPQEPLPSLPISGSDTEFEEQRENNNADGEVISKVKEDSETKRAVGSVMEYLAGVGSTVTFRVLEDDETCQMTIVEPMDKKDYNQVSKFSELGKALMDCKKGDEIKVNAIEPYTISILYVSNPVKKRIVQQPLKSEIVQQPQPKTHSKPIDNSNKQSLNGSKLGEDFILAQSGDYANFQSEVSDGLQLKHAYGTRAEDIYLDGVFCFGWNYAKRESFGRQQKLYDVKCTEDGYSVLFLPYSNLNDGRNEKVSWTDFISSDFKTIKEVWKDTDKEKFYDRTKRITFAKQKNGQYIYIGIFQAKIIDEEAKCKYYKRIGEEYFGN